MKAILVTALLELASDFRQISIQISLLEEGRKTDWCQKNPPPFIVELNLVFLKIFHNLYINL